MARTEDSNFDTKLARFLLREEDRIRNAIRIDIKEFEVEHLPKVTKYLQQWAAKRLWTTGRGFDSNKFSSEKFDYGNEIGIGLTLDLNQIPPTVRQFCYQFVQLAEFQSWKIDDLEWRIEQLKLPFYVKWWRRMFSDRYYTRLVKEERNSPRGA